MQLQNDPGLAQRMAQIEAFTQNYIQNAQNLSVNAEILYVPVVVHVVWNTGNPIENISDEQIQSQIDVIYEDFRRLNADADSTWSQAADMEIEFYLAQVDPDGNPTNGITRTESSVTSWTTDDQIKFNASGGKDAWDTTRYFNFWVGNLGGGLLGYGQFPGGNPATDGIVMTTTTFGNANATGGGSFYLSPPYNLGRTTTHEMGHYFNLYHIWGDDGGACSGSDLVDDTPNQANATGGCPSGIQTDACATTAPGYMYQNYMDYTNDACMIMFTEGQKGRMRATLEAGGPREVLNQAPFDYQMALVAPEIDICAPTDAVYDFTYNTFAGFTGTTTFSAVGLPAGASPVFSPANTDTDGTTVTLTISGLGSVAVGNYPFTIDGTSGTTVNSSNATLNVYDTNLAAPSLTAPADGATDVASTADLTWAADINAAEYDVEIASDSGFTTIVESATVSTNSYTASSLMSTTQYYWRVLHKNDCATGTYSAGRSFTTAATSCGTFAADDTPIVITTAGGVTYTSVITIQDDLTINDVNVTINIDHTYVSDLNISLQSPNGTIVDLTFGNGGSGDNYTDTVFDDAGATAITSGSPPFTGTFIPEGTLADFNGEMTLGDWTLIVTDTFAFDGGSINLFQLELCVDGDFTPDTDGDGFIDTLDNCVDIANADQSDIDGDGLGDVCDDDIDGDGVLNASDNCPETANADQADADSDGFGDVCDIDCQSFTSLDTPVAIGTGAGATYTAVINIADDLPIDDVNVTINIEHTWISDLFITLQSPYGTVVDLTLGNGGSGDNYTDTVFDDDGGTSITGGTPPFTGTFQPEGNLSDFTGESTTGDWTLTVTDTATGDGGAINLFELELCVVGEFAQDTDGDGVNDLADNCVDIANADQADLDGDGLGDVCDDDRDGDGVLNTADNCPDNANPDQGDLNGNGIGDYCDVECEVATSGDTPITIAGDAAATESYTASVEIMENVIISDINVTVNISHVWDSDLNISLRSPGGATIDLSSGNGGSGDNYTNTVFDQEASTFITSGSAPFTGSFVPEGDLSALYGEYALGNWSLIVTDTFGPLDGGTINSFTLEVCGIRNPVDWDVDGVPNVDDNCLYTVNPDQSDVDGDGIGDICDPDIDNDGVLNAEDDNCAYNANSDQSDIDEDGLGDACDPDIDNDTILNDDDNCPETPNENQSDVDRNGIGDVCDGLIVNDVLTPNSDGFNDTWAVVNIERFQDAKLHVYNRWGNEVFSAVNYNNDWNGTSGSSGNASAFRIIFLSDRSIWRWDSYIDWLDIHNLLVAYNN